MTTIPWLTPLQQDVGIFLLIVASAILVLLGLAGGVVWYFAFKSGNSPLALVLLLPILLPTVIFFPFIVLFGVVLQHIDESQEAANRAQRQELATAPARASVQQPIVEASPRVRAAEVSRSQPPSLPDWTPAPTA